MHSDETILSPCIRNCCLDDFDICLGCFRSLAEIIAWSESDNLVRQQILANSSIRREEYNQKHKDFFS